MNRSVRLVCAAVVFDLDDTLLDHRGAAQRAIVHWARDQGATEASSSLVARWFALEREFYRRFQTRELTMREQRRERVRRFLPGWEKVSDEVLDGAFEEYWSSYRAEWSPFDDALPAVERALDAGMAVGILTNGDYQLQAAKADRLGLDATEVLFVASSSLSAAKPDRRAFDQMKDRMGPMDVRTLAMVGDSWENDVVGALSAGWQAVLLDRGEARRPETPRVPGVPTVRTLDDLHFDRS